MLVGVMLQDLSVSRQRHRLVLLLTMMMNIAFKCEWLVERKALTWIDFIGYGVSRKVPETFRKGSARLKKRIKAECVGCSTCNCQWPAPSE